MAKKTVDQKTVDYYQSHGYLIDKAERQTGPIKHDLFGFVDFVALDPRGAKTIGIQACSYKHMAARRKKIQQHGNYKAVKKNWEIHLVGFHPDSDTPAKRELL